MFELIKYVSVMTISMFYAFQDRPEKISPTHSGGAGYEAASYITKLSQTRELN